ncbi:DUF808 family protein, partial [Arthrobacter sp. TmT3-37]
MPRLDCRDAAEDCVSATTGFPHGGLPAAIYSVYADHPPHVWHLLPAVRPRAVRGRTVSGGLVALLDDVAALARIAAASMDDVAAGAAKAGTKAAGV